MNAANKNVNHKFYSGLLPISGKGNGCEGWKCPKIDKWIDGWRGK